MCKFNFHVSELSHKIVSYSGKIFAPVLELVITSCLSLVGPVLLSLVTRMYLSAPNELNYLKSLLIRKWWGALDLGYLSRTL